MWGLIAAAGIGAVASALGQRSANKQAQEQSVEQASFQERMANTTYQRGTTDMKAAGLNPMLAYMQGGAPSPQGAAAPVQNTMSGMTGLAATAIDSLRLKNETSQAKAQLELTQNSAKNTLASTAKLKEEQNFINKQSTDYDKGAKSRETGYSTQAKRNDMDNKTMYIDKAGSYLKNTKDFFTPKFKIETEKNDNSAKPKSNGEYFNPKTKKWTPN